MIGVITNGLLCSSIVRLCSEEDRGVEILHMTQWTWLSRFVFRMPQIWAPLRGRHRLVAKPNLEVLSDRDGPTSLTGAQSSFWIASTSGVLVESQAEVVAETPRIDFIPCTVTSVVPGVEPDQPKNPSILGFQTPVLGFQVDDKSWLYPPVEFPGSEADLKLPCPAKPSNTPILIAQQSLSDTVAQPIPLAFDNSIVSGSRDLPIGEAALTVPAPPPLRQLSPVVVVADRDLPSHAIGGSLKLEPIHDKLARASCSLTLKVNRDFRECAAHQTDFTKKVPRHGWQLDESAVSAVSEGGTIRPLSVEAANATILTVVPQADANAQPLQADTEVFRITRMGATGGAIEVTYRLAAHSGGEAVSVNRVVKLSDLQRELIVTAGSTIAASQPQILTILLHEKRGLATSQATLFLTTPISRIADTVLLEAYRQGRSAEAFEVLMQRHAAAVARISQQIVGNRADAEDISQYVFLKLARWQGPIPTTLAGWLRTVSKNASLTLLRARRRRKRYERAAAKPCLIDPGQTNNPDERLVAALQQLPAKLETAVRLRYFEGLSQQEAAQVVGCPRGTLSRRVADGIQVLRELLGRERAMIG